MSKTDFDIDFRKVDLYELFEILPESSESEIKRAYRKQALRYHPDKNPDDPKANETFQKLAKALEVLTDKEARSSYDKILKARKERDIRLKKLDAKRRKLKDELDAKERQAQDAFIQKEEDKLRNDIERIRKEGSKQLKEANELLQHNLEEQRKKDIIKPNQVKLKRKGKTELSNELILRECSCFGNILNVIVSENKKSAILEYENYKSLIELNSYSCEYFDVKILSCNTKQNLNSIPQEKSDIGQGVQTKIKILEEFDDFENLVMKQMQEASKGCQ